MPANQVWQHSFGVHTGKNSARALHIAGDAFHLPGAASQRGYGYVVHCKNDYRFTKKREAAVCVCAKWPNLIRSTSILN